MIRPRGESGKSVGEAGVIGIADTPQASALESGAKLVLSVCRPPLYKEPLRHFDREIKQKADRDQPEDGCENGHGIQVAARPR